MYFVCGMEVKLQGPEDKLKKGRKMLPYGYPKISTP
jgi:hypothetical protein